MKYYDILKDAYIVSAIRILELPCFQEGLNMEEFTKWSTDTHTFVITWGEFTQILKHAKVLLALSSFGT